MNNKNNIDGIKRKPISPIKKVSKRSIPIEKKPPVVQEIRDVQLPRKYNITKVSRVDVDLARNSSNRIPPVEKNISSVKRERKTPFWVKIFIPIVLGLTASAVLINQFDSAVIRVEPMVKKADISRNITSVAEGNSQQLEFSMIAFTETQSIELAPDTEEMSQNRASGTIRIFNDYSTSPQKLSPKTRFESVDGKIFLLGDEELIIPGKSGDIPGEVLATVYAQEPGESYNIDVTDFSIPGFLEIGLNEKYTGIYALSTQAFSGGSSGMVPAISKELKDRQTKDLELKVQSALEERLLSEKTVNMQLIENSVSIVFKEPRYEIKDGGKKGTLSVSGSIFALLLDTQKLASYLAIQELGVQSPDEVSLLDGTNLVALYTGFGPINYQSISSAQIKVSGTAYFVWNLNKEKIAEIFAGTQKKDVAITSKQSASIGSVRITNHPRWRNILPLNEENIEIREIPREKQPR